MSDFFSNLMARSFADAPAIQPRLPSRFEAGGAGIFSENHTVAETSATPTGQKKINSPVSVEKKSENFPAPEFEPVKENDLPAANGKMAEQLPAQSFFETVKNQAHDLSAAPEKNPQTLVTPAIRPVPNSPDKNHFSETARKIHQSGSESQFEAKSADGAPTINVTIGRVEVRAIHQAAPKPKSSKPAPPKLSLDDYLQKNNGGAR